MGTRPYILGSGATRVGPAPPHLLELSRSAPCGLEPIIHLPPPGFERVVGVGRYRWLPRAGRARSRTCLRVGPRESDRSSAVAPAALLQIVAELIRARGVAELAECLRLDLPDPLPGH